MTLFPNRSAPSIRLLVDSVVTGCELKMKLSTGGEVNKVGIVIDCVNAEEKSTNSETTGAAVGAFDGAAFDQKADLKSPKCFPRTWIKTFNWVSRSSRAEDILDNIIAFL